MRRLLQRLLNWLWGVPAPPPLPLLLLAAPLPKLVRVPLQTPDVIALPMRVVEAGYERWASKSEFYFKRDILDELERYMHYVARMKTADPDAFNLYSRIGARICNPDGSHQWSWLESSFVQALPTFGCIAFALTDEGRDPQTEKAPEDRVRPPRFIYFTKYARVPADVEPVAPGRGSVYLMTAYFDFDLKSRSRIPLQFALAVRPDGRVDVLRTRSHTTQVVRHKHGDWRDYSSDIPHTQWRLPRDIPGAKMSGAAFAQFNFIYAANMWMASSASMTHITCTKDNLTAAFAVDVLRMPYFFKDRTPVLNDKGQKARIFHIVRTHTRSVGNEQRGVKTHFRGLRSFRWNGYDIRISVPGRDHAAIEEWSAGAMLREDATPGERMLTQAQLGAIIADHVKNGWKTMQRWQ